MRKRFFARNRRRQNEAGYFFSNTAEKLTSVFPIIINVFFTPALITTSLISTDVILILANISLSLGYLINFSYRLYHKEVSIAELLITVLTLAVFLLGTYHLMAPIAVLSLLNGLNFVNQMAGAINVFFLISHTLVPPIKRLIENTVQLLGFNIAGRYYSRPPLTLEDDLHVVNLLLKKYFNHDSFSNDYKPQELECFNRTLLKLCEYINRYDESFFGYLKYKEAIAKLEGHITLLTIQGDAGSSYEFIKRKIEFKKTKVHLLQQAEAIVGQALSEPNRDHKPALAYFKHYNFYKKSPRHILDNGLNCIKDELNKQNEKIRTLEECLPTLR